MSSDTSRVTVRLPTRDVDLIDALVETGEFTTRTAVIRRAIREFLKSQGAAMAESVKSEQELTNALLQMKQMQEQMQQQQQMLEKLLRE
ncbi:MAG: ribbon-helix-helix domain-containing protein [Candidatus Thermoplasmatota archaeon]|nr:ribbon-helix-helix domain-containing protein [Candidatus Thermoplasmatota archaeon]